MKIVDLIAYLKSKKYTVYSRVNEINIIGIRNRHHKINEFNDRLIVFYNDESNNIVSHEYVITTMPGKYWLQNLINKDGTAILVENQYRNTYQIDKHQNKYDALCQRLAEVKCYRDKDRDTVFDMEESSITSGYYGINIHRANTNMITKLIDKNSAGCQVFKSSFEFDEFMKLCYTHKNKYGNRFTYTLISEIEMIMYVNTLNLSPLPIHNIKDIKIQ